MDAWEPAPAGGEIPVALYLDGKAIGFGRAREVGLEGAVIHMPESGLRKHQIVELGFADAAGEWHQIVAMVAHQDSDAVRVVFDDQDPRTRAAVRALHAGNSGAVTDGSQARA